MVVFKLSEDFHIIFNLKDRNRKGELAREFHISTENRNLTIRGMNYFALISTDVERATFKETPYALCKAEIVFDWVERRASSQWQIEAIMS